MRDPIHAVVDAHGAARKEIFEHVGYVEDWCVYPLNDQRVRFWRIDGGEGPGGELLYADTKADLLNDQSLRLWSASIYTQRFLPRWVYRGPILTLVVGDTHCDGNKFLFILDNDKERPR